MSNYVLTAFIALIIGLLVGYKVTTWRYEAKLESTAVQSANQAAQAQSKIITKTQTVSRIIHEKPDACLSKHVPDELLKQLR